MHVSTWPWGSKVQGAPNNMSQGRRRTLRCREALRVGEEVNTLKRSLVVVVVGVSPR